MEDESGIVEELKTQLENAMEQLKNLGTIVEDYNDELGWKFAITATEPLEITGTALVSGIWKNVYYSPEQLSKEAKIMKEKLLKLPLIVEHGQTEKYGTRQVGKHTDFYYEPTLEALVYKAIVTDPEAIGDIKSGNLFATSMKTDMKVIPVGNIMKGYNFTPLENSLTSHPACDKCIIFQIKESRSKLNQLSEYLNNQAVLRIKGVNNMTEDKEEIEITEEDVLVLPEEQELNDGLEVEAEIVTLSEALKTGRKVARIKPGKYPKKIKKFVYYYGYPYPKYPYYGYYPYYYYPAKKSLDLEFLDYLELSDDYKTFIKKCMKEKTDIKEVTARMKACGLEWKKEGKTDKEEEKDSTNEGEEMNEELAGKKVVCPVDNQEFPSFAAFKKHWNEEHAEKYGTYKKAKKLFKTLSDKSKSRAFKAVFELAEEQVQEEETGEEKEEGAKEAGTEKEEGDKAGQKEKQKEEQKETGGEAEEAGEEKEEPITATELIKKAREAGLKPGELFAEMELKTWKEG